MSLYYLVHGTNDYLVFIRTYYFRQLSYNYQINTFSNGILEPKDVVVDTYDQLSEIVVVNTCDYIPYPLLQGIELLDLIVQDPDAVDLVTSLFV